MGDVDETGEKLANLSITASSDTPSRHGSSSSRARLPSGPDKDVSRDSQARFNKLVTKAKLLASEGHVRQALQLNKKALEIYDSDKLVKRIAKMESYLKEYGEDSSEEEEDNGMMHVGNGFYLYRDLYTKLYSHQKEGVLWLWSLFKMKKGGILGDDMGLGKTIQVIAFLSGLFDTDKVKSVLIVLPVALMVTWEREIEKWAPGIRVLAYHGCSKKERERVLAKIHRRGGVCLTTYGLVVSSWDKLSQEDGREFVWDYVILDEGHKIKNPTKTSKGVQAIGARNRIILTGTPIQNNLQELWALFDFVHQGSLLGTRRTFKMEYDTPITRAREKDATVGEKRLGIEMAESLKRIISPYFLRRTKAEVTERTTENKENQDPNTENTESKDDSFKMPSLTRKNDLIVWLFLTTIQQKIYEDFISLDDVKELLMTHKSPLVALTVLKKLCDHPRLMSARACSQLGLTADDGLDEDDLESERGLQCAANQIQYVPDDVLISESGKMKVLAELLDNLKDEGHRCLVFSQSTKMLNIIQKVITNRGHKVVRLDGSIREVSEREQRIKKFQHDQSFSVFLLTTQVGGVGLTLTAADRVVIFDPSWNPATDAQAVDRVFRIGQDKNVVIYRLITCGTVEEKIYRRQIFKDSITRQTTGSTKNPYRYFTKQELKELFSLDNAKCSSTQQQLQEMHGHRRDSDTKLDAHIAYLHSLDIFGISDHDLMFKVEKHHEDDEAELDEGNDYIQSRVQKAQELLHMESNLSGDIREQMAKYPRSVDVDPSLRQQRQPKPKTSPPEHKFSAPEVINIDSPPPPRPPPVQVKHEAGSPGGDQVNDSSEYQCLSPDSDDQSFHSPQGRPNLEKDADTNHAEAQAQALQVQAVFPHMPENVILEDLQITRSVDDTMNNILEGRLVAPSVPNEICASGDSGENDDSLVIIPPSPGGPDMGQDNSAGQHEIQQPIVKVEPRMDGYEDEQVEVDIVRENEMCMSVDDSPAINPDSSNLAAGIVNIQVTATPNNRSLHTQGGGKIRTPGTSSLKLTPSGKLSTPSGKLPTPNGHVNHFTPGGSRKTPLNFTPNRSMDHLIHEEIFISPDASKPIIKIEPRSTEKLQPFCPPRRFRHSSSDPIRCHLDASVMLGLDDDNSPSHPSTLRNAALYTTVVEDSPDSSELHIRRPDARPRMSRLSVGNPRSSLAVVLDSVENSPIGNDLGSSCSDIDRVTESDNEQEDAMVGVVGDSGGSEAEADSRLTDTSVSKTSVPSSVQSSPETNIVDKADPFGGDNDSIAEESKTGSESVANGVRRGMPVDSDHDSNPDASNELMQTGEDDPMNDQSIEDHRDAVEDSSNSSMEVTGHHVKVNEDTESSDVPVQTKKQRGKRSKVPVSSEEEDNNSDAEIRNFRNKKAEEQRQIKKKSGPSKSRISSSEDEDNNSDAEMKNSCDEQAEMQRQRSKKAGPRNSRISSSEEEGGNNSDAEMQNSHKKGAKVQRQRIKRSAPISSSEEEGDNNSDAKTSNNRKAEVQKEKDKRVSRKSRISSSEEDRSPDDAGQIDRQRENRPKQSSNKPVENSGEEEESGSCGEEDVSQNLGDEVNESREDESNISNFIDDEEEASSSEGDDSEDEESGEEDPEGSGEQDHSEEEDGSEEDSEEEEEDAIPEMYTKLETKARKLYKCQKYEEALASILQALEIHADEGLQALALKIHQKINR